MKIPRQKARGHPDRSLSVEGVIEPGYQALVLRMMQKGMGEEEIAMAIESLAQAHLDTIVASRETEGEIAELRRAMGLPSVAPLTEPIPPMPAAPPVPPAWPPILFGAASAAAILGAIWLLA